MTFRPLRLSLGALFALCISVSSAQDVEFLASIGAFGSGPGEFNAPANVVIDSSRNIYVADFANDRIQKFDVSGRFIREWGSSGSGPGQFDGPIGLAITAFPDRIVVLEQGGHRVQRFDLDGVPIDVWGGPGSGDGQFANPADIDSNNSQQLYIVDRDNHRVQRFGGGGTHRGSFGMRGSGEGEFEFPSGIVISPNNGDIYIADEGNNRVQRFGSDFRFHNYLGAPGSGPGELDGPIDIAVSDESFRIFVVDRGASRLQTYDREGNFLGGFDTASLGVSAARGIAVRDNRIYLVDQGGNQVLELRDILPTMEDIRYSNNQSENERYAQSLTVSANRVAVGIPGSSGSVAVYRRNGDRLVLEEMVPPPAGMVATEFGDSVAILDDLMVVGAPAPMNTKIGPGTLQAAVFQRSLSGWQFKASLAPASQGAGDRFGSAVAMSGDMIAVGAPMDSGGVGSVYLFQLDRTTFGVQETARLTPGPGGKGGAFGGFGSALSFKGGLMAVGAPGGSLAGSVAGSVSIFNTVQDNLSTPVSVQRGMNMPGDTFGNSVSLDGGNLLVGAPEQNQSTGGAFAFLNVFAASAQGFAIPTPLSAQPGSRFGASVALMRGAAIIGSPGVFVPPNRKGLSSGASFSFSLGSDGASGGDASTAPASGVCDKAFDKGCNIPGVENYGESSALGGSLSAIGAPSDSNADAYVFVEFDPEYLFRDGGFEQTP